MAKTGPKPRPTHLKAVRGERADRLPKAEVQPGALPITPPAWLSTEALEHWHRLADDLTAKRVLTAWDTEQFAQLCDALARRARAATELDREGEVITSPVFDRNGVQTGERPARSLWFDVWKQAGDTATKLSALFGLTPSDRARLDLPSTDTDKRPAARLLS